MSTTAEPDVEEIPVLDKEPKGKIPDTYVVGDNFYTNTSDGFIRVPLRFKTKLFRKIVKSEGDIVEQFLDLIEGIGDADTLTVLDELDIFESARIASDYFRAWQAKNEATMGEARRSLI